MKRVAICGCGGIANVHAEVLLKMNNIDLLSCCDSDYEKAVAFGKKYNIKTFKSLSDMLTSDIDTVHIATPHYAHVPQAIYAMTRGIDVLTEKPAGINTEELSVLSNVIQSTNAKYGVCFQNRFNYSSQKAYELISSDEAGKVKGARGIVTWSRNDAYYSGTKWRGAYNTEGGGVLINQAIHTLDLMIWLVGNPKSVIGKCDNYGHTNVSGVCDTANCLIDFDDGVRAVFYATLNNSNDDDITLEIYCENMTLNLSGNRLFIDGKEITYDDTFYMPAYGKDYWGNAHAMLIKKFYESYETSEPFSIGLHEATKSIKLLTSIYKSSDTGSKIEII